MFRVGITVIPLVAEIANDAGADNLPAKPRPVNFTAREPRLASLLVTVIVAVSLVDTGV